MVIEIGIVMEMDRAMSMYLVLADSAENTFTDIAVSM